MKIHEMMRVGRTEGLVGIEVEVEGKHLPGEDFDLEGWRSEEDGSLRGEESMEFVFRGPVSPMVAEERVRDLYREFALEGVEVDADSPRTSIHVHINFQDETLKDVINMCILYYMLEDSLFNKLFGDFRRSSFYCLPLSAAEYPLTVLENEVKHASSITRTDTGALRYSALNLAALSKYGSLEFRAMRGTDDPDLILSWVKILVDLKAAAMEFESPLAIVKAWGEEGVFSKIFESALPFLDEGWEREAEKALACVLPLCNLFEDSLAEEVIEPTATNEVVEPGLAFETIPLPGDFQSNITAEAVLHMREEVLRARSAARDARDRARFDMGHAAWRG